MNIINNIVEGLFYSSLALFAGVFLFTPGSLTILGWLVFVPMFTASTGKLALLIYYLLPEKEEASVPVKGKGSDINPDTVDAAEAYAKKNAGNVVEGTVVNEQTANV